MPLLYIRGTLKVKFVAFIDYFPGLIKTKKTEATGPAVEQLPILLVPLS